MTISVAICARQGALYGVEVNGKSYTSELYNITITVERTLFGSKRRLTINRSTPLARKMYCQYLEPFFSAKVHIILKHRRFGQGAQQGGYRRSRLRGFRSHFKHHHELPIYYQLSPQLFLCYKAQTELRTMITTRRS